MVLAVIQLRHDGGLDRLVVVEVVGSGESLDI